MRWFDQKRAAQTAGKLWAPAKIIPVQLNLPAEALIRALANASKFNVRTFSEPGFNDLSVLEWYKQSETPREVDLPEELPTMRKLSP